MGTTIGKEVVGYRRLPLEKSASRNSRRLGQQSSNLFTPWCLSVWTRTSGQRGTRGEGPMPTLANLQRDVTLRGKDQSHYCYLLVNKHHHLMKQRSQDESRGEWNLKGTLNRVFLPLVMEQRGWEHMFGMLNASLWLSFGAFTFLLVYMAGKFHSLLLLISII